MGIIIESEETDEIEIEEDVTREPVHPREVAARVVFAITIAITTAFFVASGVSGSFELSIAACVALAVGMVPTLALIISLDRKLANQ